MLAFLDDLILMLVTITVWTCAKSFAIAVKHATKELIQMEALGVPVTNSAFMTYWLQIDKYYKALQHLASLVNSTFGLFYAVFIIEEILFYSTSFSEIFVQQHNNDWSTAFRSAIFFCNMVIFMIFSANVVSQVEQLHEFLNISKPTI